MGCERFATLEHMAFEREREAMLVWWCSHVCRFTCTHILVEAKGQPWLSFLRHCGLILFFFHTEPLTVPEDQHAKLADCKCWGFFYLHLPCTDITSKHHYAWLCFVFLT